MRANRETYRDAHRNTLHHYWGEGGEGRAKFNQLIIQQTDDMHVTMINYKNLTGLKIT